jgi:hypothetical protein
MQSYVVAGVLVIIGIAIFVHPPYSNRHLHLTLIAVAFCLALAEAQQSTVPSTTPSKPAAVTHTDLSEPTPGPAPTTPFKHTFDPTSGKYETECRRILEDMLQLPFPKVRPVWLKNNKTNRRLEIDMYCQQLNLACEYNGRQHYEYTPRFHKSEADFLYQKEKDAMKARSCKEHGVTLISVPHTIPFEQLKTYILELVSNSLVSKNIVWNM